MNSLNIHKLPVALQELLALALYLPFLAGVFRFSPLPPDELAAAFALGLASVVWFRLLKLFRPEKTP
jgi:hypothetical protein